MLAEQGRLSRRTLAGFRPGRLALAVWGVVLAAVLVAMLAIAPLLVQRLLAYADLETPLWGMLFTAITLTVLAKAALTYVGTLVVAYATAVVFAPRDLDAARRPDALIWGSLHRLGSATSIAIVLVVAGAGIGIGLIGEWLQDETSVDSPGELGGIQLGALLFVLTIALAYESIRLTAALLNVLPGIWRWLSALIYPCVLILVVWMLLPTWAIVHSILVQWAPVADVDAMELAEEPSSPLIALVLLVVLWLIELVRSGAVREVVRGLRR